MDDVPSRYVLPSVSIRYGPFPRSMIEGLLLFPLLHLGKGMPEISHGPSRPT